MVLQPDSLLRCLCPVPDAERAGRKGLCCCGVKPRPVAGGASRDFYLFPGSSSLTRAGARAIAHRTKAVILAYWLGKAESYLWVVTDSRVTSHRSPASEIHLAVDEYNGLILSGRDPLTSELPAGDKLRRILVDPALAEIRKGDRVVVVPDGSLHSLNFEALPVRHTAPHFWIEDVRLRVTPSLAL